MLRFKFCIPHWKRDKNWAIAFLPFMDISGNTENRRFTIGWLVFAFEIWWGHVEDYHLSD